MDKNNNRKESVGKNVGNVPNSGNKSLNTVLDVSGMHCASCSTMVNKALNKSKGVIESNVNLTTSKATITFDPKVLDVEKLITIIKNRGYGAKISIGGLKDQAKKQKKEIKRLKNLFSFSLIFAVPAFIIGMVFMWIHFKLPYEEYILWALATPVQFIVGKEFYVGAFSALKNKTTNMDTLIALGTSAAYFYSVYAVLLRPELGQYFEASAVLITLVIMGRLLEESAKGKTSDAIKKLMHLSPKIATVIRNKKELKIKIDDVIEGDIIVVKPGESIPVDGKIVEGHTSIDESMITGESIPVEKKVADMVIGGTINKNGSIRFKALKVGKNTTLSQIIKLIEDAQGKKAPIQRFADIISSYFVPTVIAISIVTFISWTLLGKPVDFAILTGVAVLVIACPCALGLATPTAIMVGTGKGAKAGILIKGGDSLEKAHKIKSVIFDKTGTITNGTPEVTDLITVKPNDSVKETDLLLKAASIEQGSEHPLAEAIVENAKVERLKLIKATNFEAIPGHGIKANLKSNNYLFGNQKLMNLNSVSTTFFKKKIHDLESDGKTVMILAENRKVFGIVGVADKIKDTSRMAVEQLKRQRIKVFMITGDNERTAKAIAKQAGIVNVFASVLPDEKAKYVKKLQRVGPTAMIGDGINDAPALAQADIGIAMGSGTDVAMESGDIVLMKNDLLDVPKAIKLSKQTMAKIRQNMFWALFYNVMGIPVAAGLLYPFTGWLLNPMIAGAAMAMSSVSVVSNSLLLKYKKL